MSFYTRTRIYSYIYIYIYIYQAVTADLALVRDELARRIELLDRTARELREERFLVTAHSRYETRFENDSRQVSALFLHMNYIYLKKPCTFKITRNIVEYFDAFFLLTMLLQVLNTAIDSVHDVDQLHNRVQRATTSEKENRSARSAFVRELEAFISNSVSNHGTRFQKLRNEIGQLSEAFGMFIINNNKYFKYKSFCFGKVLLCL